MSKPPDQVWILSETLTLCEFKGGGSKGFWLYDITRGMNLSIRVESEREAFIDALEYYQERLLQAEGSLSALQSKVNTFVASVMPDEE